MENGRKQSGRPRKTGDSIEFGRFVRAGAAMNEYDEARESGENTASPSRKPSILSNSLI